MYYLKTEGTFDSAHFLKDYDGKCSNLHGHCWRVVVKAGCRELVKDGQERGMVMDFAVLKKHLRSLCDEYDHCLIYESGSLMEETILAFEKEHFRVKEVDFRPTAENFARYFYYRLKEENINVCEVAVYETAANCAIYEEEK